MDAARLSNAIVDQLEADLGFTFTVEQRAAAVTTWTAFATALIEEISTNATLSVQAGDIVTGGTDCDAAVLTGRIS